MRKIVVSFIVFTLLTFGTALASPKASIENQSIQSYQIGIVDVNKIMIESPMVKVLRDQLNQIGNEMSRQLETEKANLTPEEFKQKQEEIYGQFMRIKKGMEDRVDADLHQSLAKLAKEKNLVIIFYKNGVNFGGLDVTMDVVNSMVASPEIQALSQVVQTSNIGFIDANKVMHESPMVKAYREKVDKRENEINNQLEVEKIKLTTEEFSDRRQTMLNELSREKQEMESKIDLSMQGAVGKIAKEKNLIIIVHKNSVAWGGVDVTTDIINNME